MAGSRDDSQRAESKFRWWEWNFLGEKNATFCVIFSRPVNYSGCERKVPKFEVTSVTYWKRIQTMVLL